MWISISGALLFSGVNDFLAAAETVAEATEEVE